MLQLNGKVAVVTGAARGIGRSISLALSTAGADMALIDLTADSLQGVLEEVTANGSQASVHGCDITDTDAVAATFKEILEQHDAVHILVNNAGITRDNLLMRLSPEDWEAPIRTNLTGAFNCTKAAVRPMMRQRSGRIINIASVVGLIGNAGQANYAASKAGLIGLTKSTAKEFGSRGITVNAIAPGFITTDMTADLPETVTQKLTENIPLGRMGKPEDVASAVAFLASEEAGYITGQTLLVDGGMVM
ncbi:MAG: 3-oxoacyl-[acyl-carrier-protein] reductase [Fidelibacterota bacterium]|nr:MAG: 3-oxoacyl-[acyl-carrier-protein] reductase [Candidatus Neomarinimicrobiota bacterium]